MKRITSILLAMILVLGMCGGAMLTIGAEEATSDTWDGTANIKWYLDGPNADDVYELKTAEDLAGLAFLVGAANTEGRYTGVYHSADGTVAGYAPGSNDVAYRESAYIPTSIDGLTSVKGDTFLGKTVALTVDIILNEGDAEDWAEQAPANMWQPIGGNCHEDAKKAGFDGFFDGQGHTVSGLYFKANGANNGFGGLFGWTGQQFLATIKNLKLTNFYVSGEAVGTLVGRSNKGLKVENVYVGDGIVETTGTGAGALVGTVFGGAAEFTYCAVENVKVQGNKYMGIFTGMTVAQDISINNCYVKNSSVKGDGQVGLVCGRMKAGELTIQNLYAIVELEATGTETETNSQLAGAGLVYGVAGDNNKPRVRSIEGFFHISTVTGAVINEEMTNLAAAIELTQITGEMAKVTMPGLDYENVWKTVDGGTPVIELRGSAAGDNEEDDDDDFFFEDENGGSNNNNSNNNNNNNNGGNQSNNGDTTTTTGADDTANTTGTSEQTSEDKGCGIVVGFSGLIFTTILAGAAVMLKKED